MNAENVNVRIALHVICGAKPKGSIFLLYKYADKAFGFTDQYGFVYLVVQLKCLNTNCHVVKIYKFPAWQIHPKLKCTIFKRYKQTTKPLYECIHRIN